MEFEFYFAGVQKDLRLLVLAAFLCALFRLAFILVYRTKKTPTGEWGKWGSCFRYGFWWGMDINAYIYLLSMALVSLPEGLFPGLRPYGNDLRLRLGIAYSLLLYTAFMGKLIFYYHFRDTYNQTLKLGGHADKMNLLDIFFRQNHGGWILLSYVPFVFLVHRSLSNFLALPTLPYISLDSQALQYALNTVVFLLSVLSYYWIHYGGTLNHRNKPEWDEVPTVVKRDIFMGKAVIDDLVALKMVAKRKVADAMYHSDEESALIIKPILPKGKSWKESPLEAFIREAKGPRIEKPRHIFLLFAESHAQSPFDPFYASMKHLEGSMKFRSQKGTVAIQNFLPGGMISQPSLVSLLSGIYDANLELNETGIFWEGTVPTSLPLQLKKLGYRAEFWYGGNLSWSSMSQFTPAVGFDASYGGPEFCPKGSPRTWLGIYDHIFLEEAAKIIAAQKDEPTFHFLYTTSNHGPYKIPYENYGFDLYKVMPNPPQLLLDSKATCRKIAGIWYSDQALAKFIFTMQEIFPGSLFILTGDHSMGAVPYEYGAVKRMEPTLREELLTSFAISHPDLTKEIIVSDLGCHMNIIPTLIEILAPKGFCYYALAHPLTEQIDHVVTPYCWMTHEKIGRYENHQSQSLAPSSTLLPYEEGADQFTKERDALCEITSYLLRHPEVLLPRGGA